MTTPKGSITTSYGSFGTSDVAFNLGYGGAKWGNFISVSGLNGGRFLDPPEFTVIHAKGNQENIFDRVDFQIFQSDSIHLNLGFTRSWFQTPNSFDNLNVGADRPVRKPGGANRPALADQDIQHRAFVDAAAESEHRIYAGGFVRRDQYNYYPSNNPFADLGPIQQETIAQDRTLTNMGLRSDFSHVKGIHNIKAGVTISRRFCGKMTVSALSIRR